eukprot:TRINITY_DN124823_c0_g1_i1.p1 TRINITY_DN124823_c0_g1~~TRINITY_DN124823_c0_g1_i1.p1  ORF type:complete len:860 (-),score=160.17 TRINITY_DN124823_c0_g1_i1:232-2745(-)
MALFASTRSDKEGDGVRSAGISAETILCPAGGAETADGVSSSLREGADAAAGGTSLVGLDDCFQPLPHTADAVGDVLEDGMCLPGAVMDAACAVTTAIAEEMDAGVGDLGLDTAAGFVSNCQPDWLEEVFGRKAAKIVGSRPALAVLLRGTLELPKEFPWSDVEVVYKVNVDFLGEPRRLVVLRCRSAATLPSVQLLKLEDLVDEKLGSHYRPTSGPWHWPVHGDKVCRALSAARLTSFWRKKAKQPLRPLLEFLRIWRPSAKGQSLSLLKEHYGPSCAYLFVRQEFFAQKLWLLVPWSILATLLVKTPSEDDVSRVLWEVMKGLLVIWGIVVAVTGDSVVEILGESKLAGMHKDELKDYVRKRNPGHRKDRSQTSTRLRLAFIGFPIVFVSLAAIILGLYLLTNLVTVIIYIWGDCIHLGCTDAQEKHGLLGFLAELGTDILLAILFEVFHALGCSLASFVAEMRNCKSVLSKHFTQEMLIVTISAIERIGTFGILAFAFVPQWVQPVDGGYDVNASCEDLFLGDHSIFCMQRRLPLESRRQVFRRMFNGPFVVAPFVGIIVKVVVPWLARSIDLAANSSGCCFNRWLNCCCDAIPHLLGLIFYYDGGNIGCFRYVAKGWPFSEPVVETASTPVVECSIKSSDLTADSDSDDDFTHGGENERVIGLAKDALREGVRKDFEPMSETLEMKLGFLWVMFFAPIMPIGILPTLMARILECQTDLMKMLYVRRRVYPTPNILMHYTEATFVRATVCGAIGWYVALSLITYNDDLWNWTATQKSILGLCLVAWFCLTVALMLRRFDGGSQRTTLSAAFDGFQANGDAATAKDTFDRMTAAD